jgi:sRNA-binding carbon storage regulator CsrA
VDRRPGQRIRIIGMTEVVVLEIHPDQVRFATETDRESAIGRGSETSQFRMPAKTSAR